MQRLIFAVVAIALVCLACKKSASEPAAQVAGAVLCPPPQCIDRPEAEASVGFQSLEPRFLPAGFELYARTVTAPPIPQIVRETIARERNIPLSSVPETGAPNLTLEYRFGGSAFIPSIIIYEQKSDAVLTTITPESPGCAEVVSTSEGPVLYGMGSGSLKRGDKPGSWVGCAQTMPNDLAAHVAATARGNVIIQLRAFAESHVTRDDVLKMIASLEP